MGDGIGLSPPSRTKRAWRIAAASTPPFGGSWYTHARCVPPRPPRPHPARILHVPPRNRCRVRTRRSGPTTRRRLWPTPWYGGRFEARATGSSTRRAGTAASWPATRTASGSRGTRPRPPSRAGGRREPQSSRATSSRGRRPTGDGSTAPPATRRSSATSGSRERPGGPRSTTAGAWGSSSAGSRRRGRRSWWRRRASCVRAGGWPSSCRPRSVMRRTPARS